MSFRSATLLFRRAMAGVALASVFALSACGGDKDPSGPSGDVYRLSQVDDVDFPVDETTQTGRYRASGYIALQTNGTFQLRATFSFDPSGSGPTESGTEGADGTYVISGSTITLTPTHEIDGNTRTPATDTTPLSGTKTATSITFVDEGSTYVFSK